MRLFTSILFLAVAAGCQAQGLRAVTERCVAEGGIADVQIIDRDSGTALAVHLYHGEYWVAGKAGSRYAIEVRNRLGERVLAVTSVDGVNAVSGATAAWNQVGYVLNAGQRYQITGWRKSDAEVAAFTFSDPADSYAERTGQPANIGIIGVALFRERQAEAVAIQAPPPQSRAAGSPVLPLTADEASAGKQAMTTNARSLVQQPAPAAPATASRLGTAHGDRESSHVEQTEFTRLQPEPNRILTIHYDTLEHLLALGIVRHVAAPRSVDPFPASPAPRYAPDPPA